MGDGVKTFFLPFQFFVYNVVPYLTMMFLHRNNYKPQNIVTGKSVISIERETIDSM